jgi:hypothetical protein
MDMNPPVTGVEHLLLDKLMPLQRKQIKTRTFGQGEIRLLTRKNDLSGIWVYFQDEQKGEVKVDGEAFLREVTDILPVRM